MCAGAYVRTSSSIDLLLTDIFTFSVMSWSPGCSSSWPHRQVQSSTNPVYISVRSYNRQRSHQQVHDGIRSRGRQIFRQQEFERHPGSRTPKEGFETSSPPKAGATPPKGGLKPDGREASYPLDLKPDGGEASYPLDHRGTG